MSAAQVHLAKTLCAMCWIALMNGNTAVAKAIERDQAELEGSK